MQIFDKFLLQWHKLIKGHMLKKGQTRYFKFHQNYRQDIDHCSELVEQIESLVDRRYLGKNVSHYKSRRVYNDHMHEFSLKIFDLKMAQIPRSSLFGGTDNAT